MDQDLREGTHLAKENQLELAGPPGTLEQYLANHPDEYDPLASREESATVQPIYSFKVAKELIRIPEVWGLLGLPGHPKTCCCSPFRRDCNPSFSIYDGGRRWCDFGTGENGDVVDFVCRARSLDVSAARAFLRDLLRSKIAVGHLTPIQLANAASAPVRSLAERPKPVPPALHTGNESDLQTLAELRGLTPGGLKAARDAGVLRFGSLRGTDCWFLRDASGRSIEARRMDGRFFLPFGDDGAPHKAHSLKYCDKSWPLGLANVGTARSIILTEGGPDLLAGYDLCHRAARTDCRPVTMLGCSCRHIHPEALPMFNGKRVRIFPHADEDSRGLKAAWRWARELRAAGARVDILDLAKLLAAAKPQGKDLNDLLTRVSENQEQLALLLP